MIVFLDAKIHPAAGEYLRRYVDVTDTLARAGIRAIWNFTNTELEVADDGPLVESIHFSDSFLVLTYHLAQEDDKNKE